MISLATILHRPANTVFKMKNKKTTESWGCSNRLYIQWMSSTCVLSWMLNRSVTWGLIANVKFLSEHAFTLPVSKMSLTVYNVPFILQDQLFQNMMQFSNLNLFAEAGSLLDIWLVKVTLFVSQMPIQFRRWCTPGQRVRPSLCWWPKMDHALTSTSWSATLLAQRTSTPVEVPCMLKNLSLLYTLQISPNSTLPKATVWG